VGKTNRRVDARSDNPQFRTTFLVGILGGVLGVLVDIDHVPALFGGQASKALHTPLLVGAGIIAFYCFARLRRLLVGKVLSKKEEHHDF